MHLGDHIPQFLPADHHLLLHKLHLHHLDFDLNMRVSIWVLESESYPSVLDLLQVEFGCTDNHVVVVELNREGFVEEWFGGVRTEEGEVFARVYGER